MKTGRIIVCVLLAAALAATGAVVFCGCGGKKYNVLLVTLDTTRADHLRCYGYEQIETPGLNELARNGVLFERAYAETPLTLPAHASIMTGRVPLSHGVVDNGAYKVPDELSTIAELLKGKGYRTAAFVSAKVLDREFNLNQGFDTYDQENINAQGDEESLLVADRRGDNTTDAALRWMAENKDRRWFMWVHYYDPHMKYDPPAPFKNLYRYPYDGEIAFMDAQFMRLTEQLRKDGHWDDTVIIALGDHGESLGEHGERTHSIFIYNATTWIPFIVRFPGLKPGRVSAAVSQIDLLPTLVDFLGLELPPLVEGHSLLPVMKGEDPGEGGEVFLHSKTSLLHFGWAELFGLVSGRYRFVLAPKPELYDLESDPFEQKNLYTPDNKIAFQLRSRLEQLRKEYQALAIESQAAHTDSRTQAQLQALGYVVNGTGGSTRLAENKDAKDYIDLAGIFMGLSRMTRLSNFPKVLELSDLILKRDPTNPTAMSRRAWALFGLGRFDEALAQYMEFFKIHTETCDGWLQVGHIYTRRSQDAKYAGQAQVWKDNIVQAGQAYAKALELDRKNQEAAYFLGRIQLEAGQLDAARRQFESSPLAGTEWGSLGMAKYYQLMGRPGLAESEYSRIQVKEDQNNVVYWQEYAQFLAGEKRYREALDLLTKALKQDPSLTTDTGFNRTLEAARAGAGVAAPAPGSTTGSGSGSAPPGP